MPQLNDIVITDGTDNHSFKPNGIDNSGVATLVESTGVPIGDRRLTIGRARTTAGREKTTLKLVIPIVQDVVVNGISRPTPVRAAYADVQFSFDGTSSTAEREDVLKMTASLLEVAAVESVVRDLQKLY